MAAILTADELERIRRQAEEEYPAECCGVLLVREGPPGGRWLMPCRNDQARLHADDPVRYPRDARTAYSIATEDLLAMARAEDEGFRVAVIYHSHIEADAYFSDTDRRQAVMDGVPAYPDTVYVVVSVRAGRSGDLRAFCWQPAVGEFREVALALD